MRLLRGSGFFEDLFRKPQIAIEGAILQSSYSEGSRCAEHRLPLFCYGRLLHCASVEGHRAGSLGGQSSTGVFRKYGLRTAGLDGTQAPDRYTRSGRHTGSGGTAGFGF